MTLSRNRWAGLAAVVMALALLGYVLIALGGQSASGQASRTHTAHTHTGHVTGHLVKAQVGTKPFQPNAAQKANQKKILTLPRPPIGPHPLASSVAGPKGNPTDPKGGTQAPGSLNFFKVVTPNASCATSCAQSSVNEPDTIGSGRVLFQTSNWNIAYTMNGGAATPTWSYQNPYSLNPNFCCDQAVTYVPSRNMIVRQSLDLGSGAASGFDIALTTPWSPTVWCTYHFSGANFGATDGDLLDYPKVAYSNNNLYMTWNEYNSAGSAWLFSGLARINLDQLKGCGSVGYSYLTRNDNFTYGLSMGDSSADTFYWVSDWYTQSAGSGTAERIFFWPDNSSSYFFTDVGVASYNFSGGSCASQDGVVTNWCTRLDPRWETASVASDVIVGNNGGKDTLVVAITAGPAGSDPFPYVIYEYFSFPSLGYIGTSATFNNGFAFAYAGCSPNSLGAIGCAMTYGGGVGASHFFPAGITVVQDSYAPSQPWSFSFNQTGAGNATAWGDYEVTQPYNPSAGAWISTEWFENASGVVRPQVVIFGRNAANPGYFRWRNQ